MPTPATALMFRRPRMPAPLAILLAAIVLAAMASAQVSFDANTPGPIGGCVRFVITSPYPHAPLVVLGDIGTGAVPIQSPGGPLLGVAHLAFTPGMIALADASGVFGGLGPSWTDAQGNWEFSLPVLNVPGAVGFHFYAEAFVVSPQAPNGVFAQSSLLTLSVDDASHGATLDAIFIGGLPAPIWTRASGAAGCPGPVALNAPIDLVFSGPVSLASLPSGGTASGSIGILTLNGALQVVPAAGTFEVADDPAGGAGNRRVARFRPTLPMSPVLPLVAGLLPDSVYSVIVAGGLASSVITACLPVQNSAIACFTTCPTSAGPAGCFIDHTPGPPHLVSTTPWMAEPVPPPIDPTSISGNRITLLFDEPLSPSGLSLQSVRLVNAATGAQVPATLQFFQPGSPPQLGPGARVDYVTLAPLLPNTVYELQLGPTLTDLGGNPVVTSTPLGRWFLQTTTAVLCPQAPLVESFDSAAHRAGTSGPIVWDGSGALTAVYPFDLVGDGSDGPFLPQSNTTLDTGALVGGQPRAGRFNFTTVDIPLGVTVRVVGPYPLHLRCLGSVNIAGVLNASAGSNPNAPLNSPEQGARPGASDNGGGTSCAAAGAVGHAGAGAGGRGSPGPCSGIASFGETGFGPSDNGQPNPGPGGPGNPQYGGGGGGTGGCWPALTGCAFGDLGGLGGAGGSSATIGEDGIPRNGGGSCAPFGIVLQPVAMASPVPALFVPPIAMQSAGSGGGGGGDHFETLVSRPNGDDQGGGGGAGGGGVRISCLGAYTQGSATGGGSILCQGSPGAVGSIAAGCGGSGSGGQIWIQALGPLAITASSVMNVDGPPRVSAVINGAGCGLGAAGGGGDGLVQLEAGQGPLPAGFVLIPSQAVLATMPLGSGPLLTGTATSTFLETGYGAPDFTGAVEASQVGNAPGASVTITYEGAFESVTDPSTPDLATLRATTDGTPSGPVITAAALDALDGYRFVRFRVTMTFAKPPATPPGATLPAVQAITISYRARAGCP